MTYVARRKLAKGRNNRDGQSQQHQNQHKNEAGSKPAADETINHDFVNEHRMKELAERRGPHGLDLNGIR